MGILIPYITYKVSQKEGSNYRFLLANFNTFVLETVLGKREILQFSQQEKRFEQMMDHQNNLTQTHQKLIKHQSFQQILSDGLIILSIVISILLIKNHVSKELLIPMIRTYKTNHNYTINKGNNHRRNSMSKENF